MSDAISKSRVHSKCSGRSVTEAAAVERYPESSYGGALQLYFGGALFAPDRSGFRLLSS